jgi:hypothetical protein
MAQKRLDFDLEDSVKNSVPNYPRVSEFKISVIQIKFTSHMVLVHSPKVYMPDVGIW